jgi:hypothetical protein
MSVLQHAQVVVGLVCANVFHIKSSPLYISCIKGSNSQYLGTLNANQIIHPFITFQSDVQFPPGP